MSQEISLFRICDHHVTEDLVFISSDLMTIPVYRFIANQNSLEIKRNGFDLAVNSHGQFGYVVVNDPDTAGKNVIQFLLKQKSSDDFFELSYFTTLNWCPKCAGISIYFDWVFDNFGDLYIIENEEKLLQDLIKGTLTVEGSNSYFTWYGTILESLIGGKIADFANLRVAIGNDVNDFINNLKDLQSQQAQFQTVSDRERIQQVISIDVQQSTQNPDLVEISIIFRNRAGNIQTIAQVIDKNNRLRVTGQYTDALHLP